MKTTMNKQWKIMKIDEKAMTHNQKQWKNNEQTMKDGVTR